jgi:hypothetical protein
MIQEEAIGADTAKNDRPFSSSIGSIAVTFHSTF